MMKEVNLESSTSDDCSRLPTASQTQIPPFRLTYLTPSSGSRGRDFSSCDEKRQTCEGRKSKEKAGDQTITNGDQTTSKVIRLSPMEVQVLSS